MIDAVTDPSPATIQPPPQLTWAALLHAAHAEFGAETALLDDVKSFTYDDVLDAAGRVAAGLHAMGLPPGARVVLALDNCLEMFIVERALALWGWVRVAVGSRMHAKEVDFIVGDCGASLVICEERIAAELTSQPGVTIMVAEAGGHGRKSLQALLEKDGMPPPFPAITSETVMSLMYTSGTTGRPKGAINTHGAWYAMATGTRRIMPAITRSDILLHAAPMSHFSGSVASAYACSGAAIATLRRYNPQATIHKARRIGATCMPLVPTMLADLQRAFAHERKPLLPAMRVLPYGGSSISADTLIKSRAIFGDVLLQIYGMSEALIPVTSLSIADHATRPDERARLATAGVPCEGIELRLDDPVEGVGEIAVRGANVMTGYWDKPEQTREVLSPDGWYKTGDLGAKDAAGRIRIADRKRDVVISGGYNVYPAEVERVIAALPGVAEVAVVGAAHPRWGDAVVSVIVPEAGATCSIDDVLAICRSELAAYKKPLAVLFVNALPKTSTGKTDKKLVRKTYANIFEPQSGAGNDANLSGTS